VLDNLKIWNLEPKTFCLLRGLSMSFSSLRMQRISTTHFYTSGDVTIQDGAAIAPGVLLQADPNSRVIIKTGACIGFGAILHAHEGTVEVGEGANVGAEVLLVGSVTIGAHACIGAATTILNSSIELGRVVPPNSLIGDASRPQSELQVTDTVEYPAPEPATVVPEVGTATLAAPVPVANSPETINTSGVNVYGQVYVNQMLLKMFPHNQQLNVRTAEPNKPAQSEDPWDD
jgi:carbon dioxide concentrating mechanism protein CcmN